MTTAIATGCTTTDVSHFDRKSPRPTHCIPTSESAMLTILSRLMSMEKASGNVTGITASICEITCEYVIMMRAGCHIDLRIAPSPFHSASLMVFFLCHTHAMTAITNAAATRRVTTVLAMPLPLHGTQMLACGT